MRHLGNSKRAHGIGTRPVACLALGLALSVALLVGLGEVGKGERRPTEVDSDGEVFGTVVTGETSRELVEAWNDVGARGAVLVDATTELGYSRDDWAAGLALPAEYPLDLPDLRFESRQVADRENHVWVASALGLFRGVHYLLPLQDYSDLLTTGREADLPGIAADGVSIRANYEGYVRLIAPVLRPSTPGPRILNADASYFENGTPDELMAEISAQQLTFAATTLNYASEDDRVSDEARERLREFESMVQGAGK